eukprot:symbB.v1.2.015253.t1/scaffold1135.1/size135959/7
MLPLPASTRCHGARTSPWRLWEVATVMLQIYIWYVVAGEFAAFLLPGHDAWLSQMWLAQLLTYSLTWISLQPLLRRLPPGSFQMGPANGRSLLWGLFFAIVLGNLALH